MSQPIIARMPAKARVETLTDGIFAVVMTLLVLDLKLPPGATQLRTNADLWNYFGSISHVFLVYVLSFIVLVMYWVAHNYHFHYVRKLDRGLFWINLSFLLLITTVPFTTNLVMTQPDLSSTVYIYSANIVLLAVALLLNLQRLEKHPELATEDFARLPIAYIHRRLFAMCSVPILAILVAQLSPRWGLRMFYLLALMHFLMPHNAAHREETA